MLQNTEREIQKDNPEKLATQGTQDEEKQNKNTTQCETYARLDRAAECIGRKR
jgi:hypothetical protein